MRDRIGVVEFTVQKEEREKEKGRGGLRRGRREEGGEKREGKKGEEREKEGRIARRRKSFKVRGLLVGKSMCMPRERRGREANECGQKHTGPTQ